MTVKGDQGTRKYLEEQREATIQESILYVVYEVLGSSQSDTCMDPVLTVDPRN